ncbi:DUF6339 family protein [Streptomyces sp. NBC_01615]|uniref:DUF6339 family protein n=1 Tax=Streptomyces sp. NBC_01615 TaxID=2975898 RepID=UPI00386E3243
MNRDRRDLPDRLAILSDTVAVKYLTRAVRTGQEDPPHVALRRASTPIDDPSTRWSVAPLRDLVEEAMRRADRDSTRTRADAWLAPRLHATLRMTRVEAAESGLWNFLALVVAPDYVVWRHLGQKSSLGKPAVVAPGRFTGVHYTQAFARLWWAAELFRDGEDYGPAEVACGNQDVLHTLLRLDVIDHRPAARAAVRLIEQGTVRTGRDVNALASAINAAGSTLLYDWLAPDEPPEVDELWDWIWDADSAPPVPWNSLPDGPKDGSVRETSIATMVRCFEALFADAPVRGKRSSETSTEGREGVSLDKGSITSYEGLRR